LTINGLHLNCHCSWIARESSNANGRYLRMASKMILSERAVNAPQAGFDQLELWARIGSGGNGWI